jgi:NTP pyrophosphatase (non-canonical NTP hydrolase)
MENIKKNAAAIVGNSDSEGIRKELGKVMLLLLLLAESTE